MAKNSTATQDDEYKTPRGWRAVPYHLKNVLFLPVALTWVALDATLGSAYRAITTSKRFEIARRNVKDTVKDFPQSRLSKAAHYIRDNYTSKLVSPRVAAVSVAMPTYFFLASISLKLPLLIYGAAELGSWLLGVPSPGWPSIYQNLPFGWGDSAYAYTLAVGKLAIVAKIYKPIMLAQLFFFPQMKDHPIYTKAKARLKWAGNFFVMQPLHAAKKYIVQPIRNHITQPFKNWLGERYVIKNVLKPAAKATKDNVVTFFKNLIPKSNKAPFSERILRRFGIVPPHEKEAKKINATSRALLHTLLVYAPASVLATGSVKAGLTTFGATSTSIMALSPAAGFLSWVGWGTAMAVGGGAAVAVGAGLYLGGWYLINRASRAAIQRAAGNVTYPTPQLGVANTNAVLESSLAASTDVVVHKLHHGIAPLAEKLGYHGFEASTAAAAETAAHIIQPAAIAISAYYSYKKYKAEYARINDLIDRENNKEPFTKTPSKRNPILKLIRLARAKRAVTAKADAAPKRAPTSMLVRSIAKITPRRATAASRKAKPLQTARAQG